LHDFPIHPTLDTFSFFTVFMCHHIEPRSVGSYLSGICNQLEPYFPEVRKIRNSRLVSQTLAGCKRLRSKAIVRKQPLTTVDLDLLVDTYHTSLMYDDVLFLAMILQGFVTLIRLGEMTWPDNPSLQSWRRVPMRTSLFITATHISYVLPAHKADRYYEGSKLLVQHNNTKHDPYHPFLRYLLFRDKRFPANPELWLREDGSVPLRSWFLRRLGLHFPNNISGHSIRSGGATALAQAGVPDDRIQ
ncbi:hypothetical protein BD410DRAFT_700292, partial [Rickenella mellea]